MRQELPDMGARQTVGVSLLMSVALFATGVTASAQSSGHDAVASVRAVRTSANIEVDGRLSEEAWATAVPIAAFRQRDPDEGESVTERTQVRILYDNRSLYIGVELFDREADRIASRLSRRDDTPDSDYFALYLDPYHDHVTGRMFEVSAAGAQIDATISNDTTTDNSWDAVWDSAVSRTPAGWFLEMRIPFSQLRFQRADQPTWGINAARFIHRKNETAWLELVPRREYGLASRMAHLEGLEGIEPRHNLEILPYARSSIELSPALTGDPFNDGSQAVGATGVDVKYGISSNLVLDATVNPDFGQVEVDPAVVNLSAFETFFEERRPFFLEGSQIFGNFGRAGTAGGDSVIFPTYFYPRRIGRAPRGPASGDYVNRPGTSTILGAAKLTGKPANDWSLGLLNAVTAPEYARVLTGLDHRKVKIEPLTNHLVVRVLRESEGKAGLGMLLTQVQRRFDDPALADWMPGRATVIGGDGYYFFDAQRIWSITARMSAGSVSGNPRAIEALQRSTHHYYQRPDATHIKLDPTATALRGWAGGYIVKKNSGGWLLDTSLSASSAGFDTDESGFQGGNDWWGPTATLTWRQLNPDQVSRTRSISVFRFDSWNFENERNSTYTRVSGEMTFLNYWKVQGNVTLNQEVMDDRLTRGGPLVPNTVDLPIFLGVTSDSRKRVTVGSNAFYSSNKYGGWASTVNANVSMKASSSVTVTLEPSFDRSHNYAQYVQTVDDVTATRTYGQRYVFADLDQSSVGVTGRVNMGVTPKMSLQVYSQLLLSAGDYWRLKELERPRRLSFLAYGQNIGTITRQGDDYLIDPDGSGQAPSFSVQDPDFNFKSLRLNAVFRWEWKPGSTLFFVWTESRADTRYPGAIFVGRDLRALFSSPAENIFLIKTTYWFNR
jgi:Domain of unknown function (DUF5916)/Carbohydrate family 9 binding domain-like